MRSFLILVAAGGSAALLLGALAFQYYGGLPPCDLCITQRWPHLAAVVIGALALMIRLRLLPWLGALAALTSSAVGLYHTGVERDWWEGPSTCTSASVDKLTPDQLMEQIMSAPLIRCDEVAWDLFGLSMASWNAILALILALIWVAAAQTRR